MHRLVQRKALYSVEVPLLKNSLIGFKNNLLLYHLGIKFNTDTINWEGFFFLFDISTFFLCDILDPSFSSILRNLSKQNKIMPVNSLLLLFTCMVLQFNVGDNLFQLHIQ